MGPARAHCTTTIFGVTINEGEVIIPPVEAAAVTIDNLRLRRIIIVDKEPNDFRPGFWDIDLKYVFVYSLTFRDSCGKVIGCIKANSIYNKKVTLFGSIGTDIVIGTDLLREDATLDADPFVLVEGKAVALAAELKYCPCRRDPCDTPAAPFQNEPIGASEVLVTIGLFSIIRLFRLVDLTVESRGFCVPRECEEVSPINPCDFFERLQFPMEIFAPPVREDFRSDALGFSDDDNIDGRGGRRDCCCDK